MVNNKWSLTDRVSLGVEADCETSTKDGSGSGADVALTLRI